MSILIISRAACIQCRGTRQMVGAGGYLGSYDTAPDEQHAVCESRMHCAARNRFGAVPFPAGVRSQAGAHLSNRLSSPDSREMPYELRSKAQICQSANPISIPQPLLHLSSLAICREDKTIFRSFAVLQWYLVAERISRNTFVANNRHPFVCCLGHSFVALFAVGCSSVSICCSLVQSFVSVRPLVTSRRLTAV